MTINPRHDLYIGCEVVCVRSTYDPAQKTTITPELVEGQVYKIRWLGVYNHYMDGEYLGVRVEGIDRGICQHWGYKDQPFYADRFRPVVEDPIAMFKRIATDPEFKPSGGEGPLHPDGPLPEPKRELEKEEVE